MKVIRVVLDGSEELNCIGMKQFYKMLSSDAEEIVTDMTEPINPIWFNRGYRIEVVCDGRIIDYRKLLDSGRVRWSQNFEKMIFGGALTDVLPSDWLYRPPYADTNLEGV